MVDKNEKEYPQISQIVADYFDATDVPAILISSMRFPFLRLLAAGCVAGLMNGRELIAAEPRYVAVWPDGSQATADEVHDWGRSDSRPALAGRLFFDPKNPVRSITDTTLLRPRPIDTYVEFRGGDRLPGRVVKFVDAEREAGVPAHLIVEVAGELGLPNVFSRSQVRVIPDWVRRIVQRPPPGVNVPSRAVRVAGGGNIPFQELRWRSDGVEVLTDTGVKPFAFADITLLDSGSGNPWEAWHRQLAVLSPGLDSLIVRVDLADGTRLTTSLERLKPRSQGGDDPGKWFHLLQPAWSLDLLAAPHRKVRTRTCFASHEVPLSAIEPSASRHHAIFSQAWGTMRFDENVRGEPLRAASREFAWGFGVHAHHELEFELPSSARQFRTKLGLDPWAGPGGCARGRVQHGEQTLFESPLLVGTAPALDCGPLPLRAGRARLLLIAEADARERPQGADPFDIRDIFNWLEPVVELDPARLRRDVEPHYFAVHPLLADWTADPGDAGNWRLVNRFDDTDGGSPLFRQMLFLEAPLTLTRRLTINPMRPTALLRLGASSAQSRFEISINSRRVLRGSLPGQAVSPEALSILVPLKAAAGGSVEFTIRLDPVGKSAFIDWRGLTLIHDAERE